MRVTCRSEVFSGMQRGLPHVVPVGVDEIVDDLDFLLHRDLPVGLVAQVARNRGHRVRLLDGPLGDRLEGGAGSHEGDVGAVQRGDDLQAQLGSDLARDDGRRRERDGVVHVHDLQLVRARHLHHLRRQSEAVGELLQQRVVFLVHLVVAHARRQLAQAQRVGVADERDGMPALGEVLAQLRGHDAAAARRWDSSRCRSACAAPRRARRARGCAGGLTGRRPRRRDRPRARAGSGWGCGRSCCSGARSR